MSHVVAGSELLVKGLNLWLTGVFLGATQDPRTHAPFSSERERIIAIIAAGTPITKLYPTPVQDIVPNPLSPPPTIKGFTSNRLPTLRHLSAVPLSPSLPSISRWHQAVSC